MRSFPFVLITWTGLGLRAGKGSIGSAFVAVFCIYLVQYPITRGNGSLSFGQDTCAHDLFWANEIYNG